MPPSISPTAVHATAFSVLFLTGVLVAAGFDVGRAARRVFARGAWAVHALDALCVAAALPLVGLGLLLADWGQVRTYTVLGVAGGALAYHFLASPPLLRAEVAALRGWARLCVGTMRAARRVGRWARGVLGTIRRLLARSARRLRGGVRAVLHLAGKGKPPAGPAGS